MLIIKGLSDLEKLAMSFDAALGLGTLGTKPRKRLSYFRERMAGMDGEAGSGWEQSRHSLGLVLDRK